MLSSLWHRQSCLKRLEKGQFCILVE